MSKGQDGHADENQPAKTAGEKLKEAFEQMLSLCQAMAGIFKIHQSGPYFNNSEGNVISGFGIISICLKMPLSESRKNNVLSLVS